MSENKNDGLWGKGDSIVKRVGFILLGIAIFILFLSGLIRVNRMFSNNKASVITSSSLLDVINISELSTAQFIYNGIAEVYKDEEETKTSCHIRYNSIIRAGIDMEAVQFQVDKNEKTVKVFLPKIAITANLVDTNSISFIPENAKIDLSDAIIACEKDAEKEAKETKELMNVAKENLKSTIEALLMPLLQKQGYTITWK